MKLDQASDREEEIDRPRDREMRISRRRIREEEEIGRRRAREEKISRRRAQEEEEFGRRRAREEGPGRVEVPDGTGGEEWKPERVGRISHGGGYDEAKIAMALVTFLNCSKQAWGASGGECGTADETSDNDASMLPWIVLAVLGLMLFVGGVAAGWKIRGWVRDPLPGPQVDKATMRDPLRRSMTTQSQTTYQRHWKQPRFCEIGELMQGAHEL